MDMRKTFGGDKTLERDGVELHLGGDAYITVARAGGTNVAYQHALQKRIRPYQSKSGYIENDTYIDILKQTFADAVVLDWRGLELDGEPLPYSRDNALRLMRELPDLWDIIKTHAEKLANFQQEEIAEMGKASPTP
ncbi:MAG TPA: hypothetical protein VMS92_00465 [Mycobacterium sp.]|nr:hypothetical protein [Mycobacterium sp.]